MKTASAISNFLLVTHFLDLHETLLTFEDQGELKSKENSAYAHCLQKSLKIQKLRTYKFCLIIDKKFNKK
jgi:hypothetical protein